jgi:hypothetical protein
MPIVREKSLKEKPKKAPLKKISTEDANAIIYQDVTNKLKQKEEREIKAIKTKELNRIKEEKRLELIVLPHLDKLFMQLTEKNTLDFWVFPDRSGFKKIVDMDFDDMQTFVKSDVEKYADRKICLFKLSFTHRDAKTSIWRKSGILLIVSIVVFHMDNKAMLNGKNTAKGCTFNWHFEDFKLTKLTYKLLETIMHPIADGIFECSSLGGFPLTYVIKNLEKKGIDFTDVLIPLAGC